MTNREREAYARGFIDGLECFAWWKDGVQYVGTCGMTLKQAYDLFDDGKLWNQLKPLENLAFEGEK